jgi:pimeloyl-ACP methyl ester carboxylesterase
MSIGMPVMAAKPDKEPVDKAKVELPYLDEGVHAGAAYKIRVPENWNGKLIVYAHGLWADVTKGYPDLVIPNPMIAPGSHGGTSIEETLIEKGYALAGSSYSAAGWAVKEGIQDILALITYFNGRVGKPKQTILWGFSMGGTIAIDIAEKHAGLIDGVVVESSNGAPTAKLFDQFMGIQVAYDVIFGWPEEWGSVGDINDDISWLVDVIPALIEDIYGWGYIDPSPPHDPIIFDPVAFGKAEFFRLILGGTDRLIFYSANPPWGQLMWFVTMVGADMEKKAGGNPLQNSDLPDYILSPGDKAYLEGFLGVGVPQLLLDEMNGRDIVATPSAKNWLEHYDTPTGKLKNPVIQLHSLLDFGNPAAGTVIFRDTVTKAGKDDLLLQAYTGPGTGHGVFTENQYLQVLAAMEYWLETGEQPDPDDYFTSAYGFVTPPWP